MQPKALYFIERGINQWASRGYKVIHFAQGFSFGQGWWYGVVMELEPQPAAEVKP